MKYGQRSKQADLLPRDPRFSYQSRIEVSSKTMGSDRPYYGTGNANVPSTVKDHDKLTRHLVRLEHEPNVRGPLESEMFLGSARDQI